MKWILSLSVLLASPAFAQTACPAAPADPNAYNVTRLSWPAVTMWEGGAVIPTPTQMRYIVYEHVDGVDIRRCTTMETFAWQVDLSDGRHTWVVVAMTPLSTPAWATSPPSLAWSKTVAPPAPEPIARRPAAPASLTGT